MLGSKDMAGSVDWYDTEESTHLGMIAEVQRIRRRTRARPVPVIIVAAAVTAFITYKLATRQAQVEAEVVLALTEGSLSQRHTGLPMYELREYVSTVLLPDKKLLDLIERRHLYPSRKRMGDQYAIDDLRSLVDIQIWKNTFIAYDEEEERSARIGLTVADSDPDRAYDMARDLATIVMETAQEQRQEMTKQLAAQVSEIHEKVRTRADQLEREYTEKEVARQKAHRDGNERLAQALDLQLGELWHEQARAARTLANIAESNRESLADRISAAGLDMNVTVVEEHRPLRSENRNFVIAMIGVVIGLGSLLGAALILGAFDARIRDVDDVERLGLTVLGHLPAFAGDHVGSLQARGAVRARVPLSRRLLRWLSRR